MFIKTNHKNVSKFSWNIINKFSCYTLINLNTVKATRYLGIVNTFIQIFTYLLPIQAVYTWVNRIPRDMAIWTKYKYYLRPYFLRGSIFSKYIRCNLAGLLKFFIYYYGYFPLKF